MAPDAQTSTLATGSSRSVLSFFGLLGRVLAQALLDDRLLDLPFARPFFSSLLGRPVVLRDVAAVNGYLGKTLLSLQRVTDLMDELHLEAVAVTGTLTGCTPFQFSAEYDDALKIDGAAVDSLGLDFSAPGISPPVSILGTAAAISDVTLSNLHEFVSRMAEFVLKDSVRIPLQAIRRGFAEVADVSALRCFSESEVCFCHFWF
jgi:E3 ubiquitin-protein ligase TRIP12